MTSRSDNFNRANSTSSLGTPSDGGSAWVVLAGTWGINSNRAYTSASTSQATAYLEASSANVEVQVTVSTVAEGTILLRAVDANNYLILAWTGSSGIIYKRVAGTFTAIGSNIFSGLSAGDVVKFVANGSSLEIFRNGSSVWTLTDSTHSTATKHGMRSQSNTTQRLDDFSIVDLSGATTHATTGALTGQGSTVAGTAAHIAKHAATGVLTGQGSTVSGAARRFRAHPTLGALTGPGSVVAGAADHTTPGGSHDTTGALVGAGAAIAGAAARVAGAVMHATSGALVGQGAVIVGFAQGPALPLPAKIGGDDGFERVEIYERRQKPKKKDEELDKVMRAAFDKVMGRTPAPVQVVQPFDDEEDDIEALMLVL